MLFQVPSEYTAVQTFELFFKAHKVFGLEYEANIAPMMKICEHFFYKLPVKKFNPSLKMTDIYNKVTKRVQPEF